MAVTIIQQILPFLQIYKILAAYTLLKPPKFGNCTPLHDEPPKSLISISMLKEMISCKKSSALEEIKARLNIEISDEDSDFSDVINSVDYNYSLPPVIKCIMYYTAGTVCAKYLKHSNCSTCRHAFLSSAEGVNDI